MYSEQDTCSSTLTPRVTKHGAGFVSSCPHALPVIYLDCSGMPGIDGTGYTAKPHTVEPLVGGHPLCKKKWSPTGGGLSWEVLHGNKVA